jgi:hypothetical protein
VTSDLESTLTSLLLADGGPDGPVEMLDAVLVDFARVLSGEAADVNDWTPGERRDSALAVAQSRQVVMRLREALRPAREALEKAEGDGEVEVFDPFA